MTYYIAMSPVQEPSDLAADEMGRRRVGFNINAECAFTEAFIEEVSKVLVNAAVGTVGTNIFYTTGALLPVGDGPYLSIIEAPGAPPMHTHNERSPPAYIRPSAQIVVRAKNYTLARAMAYDAYLALMAVRNANVTA